MTDNDKSERLNRALYPDGCPYCGKKWDNHRFHDGAALCSGSKEANEAND